MNKRVTIIDRGTWSTHRLTVTYFIEQVHPVGVEEGWEEKKGMREQKGLESKTTFAYSVITLEWYEHSVGSLYSGTQVGEL